MLSTALHMVGHPNPPYKKTHHNHPINTYIRKNRQNYLYACKMLEELSQEFFNRRGKIHASSLLLDTFLDAAHMFPDGDFTEPPQCVPDSCRREDTVDAYRNLYMTEKRDICEWKWSNPPEWWS